MLKIGIIIGSTRPNRVGGSVAKWVFEHASKRTDAIFEWVDIKDYNLPLLDEPVPPAMSSNYTKEHTRVWSQRITHLDAFIFVSPEYNHSTSGALKNAMDFLYSEWNNKVAGFVAYGSMGGTRAVESLRLISAELQMATVRAQVALSLRTDFENFSVFKPDPHHLIDLDVLIDQVINWGTALQNLRNGGVVIDQLKQSDSVLDSPPIH